MSIFAVEIRHKLIAVYKISYVNRVENRVIYKCINNIYIVFRVQNRGCTYLQLLFKNLKTNLTIHTAFYLHLSETL